MKKRNQSPKGIMRSAVPLPCFIDVVKSQKVAGQRPQQGTKSCRMGRNSVRPYIRPSIHLSVVQLLGSEGLPQGSRGRPEGSRGPPKGSEGLPEESVSLPWRPKGQLLGSEALTEGIEGLPEGFGDLPEGVWGPAKGV